MLHTMKNSEILQECVCVCVSESHGSHHDHEVAVIGGTAEQVGRHAREMPLGEGAGREDVEDKPSLEREERRTHDSTESARR